MLQEKGLDAILADVLRFADMLQTELSVVAILEAPDVKALAVTC
jgi:hypothetical protein